MSSEQPSYFGVDADALIRDKSSLLIKYSVLAVYLRRTFSLATHLLLSGGTAMQIIDLANVQVSAATKQAARQSLLEARWIEGFVCPKCSNTKAYYLRTRQKFECSKCKYPASATSQSQFHNTRSLPQILTAWKAHSQELAAVSVTEIKKTMDVSYRTAARALSQLREGAAKHIPKQIRARPGRLEGLSKPRGVRVSAEWNGPGARTSLLKLCRTVVEELRLLVSLLQEFINHACGLGPPSVTHTQEAAQEAKA